nr:hypothetical protein [Fischerella sp. PCC 9605]
MAGSSSKTKALLPLMAVISPVALAKYWRRGLRFWGWMTTRSPTFRGELLRV